MYNNGFKNPKEGSPRVRRASFRSATIPAKVGDAADVPPMETGWPDKIILKRRASRINFSI